MDNAIETQNLAKKYQGKGKTKGKHVNALVDLNLNVKTGDIYGFIGPNGAGKTTTIKILTGLIGASSGSATVMGFLAGSVESKKQMGYLSEISYYYPFIEVGSLLDFYCSFYEIPGAERKKRILEVLKMVGLSEKINAKMNELSKGMQQRFGIAQAIIADPPLLILDELTSGLDPIAQKEVKDVVLKLKEQGKTIFFSSHQMTEVELICDKIGIIYNGKLLKSANLDEFIREESGNLTKIVVKAETNEIFDFLKERNITLNHTRKEIAGFVVPSTDVTSLIDAVRERKAEILEITPHRYSLEDAFFKLVKEVE